MKKIKFLVICPAAKEFRVTKAKKPFKAMKVFRFSMLSALYVAASAPKDVETKIIDENIEPIDFDSDADIIGISFMTFNAPRAYELSEIFRKKGKTVIFGGYHPSLLPKEAIKHCDAVCIGEAESNIPRIIEDFRRKKLKKFYRYPYKKFRKLNFNENLLDKRQYISPAVQATRGCYNKCEFCSIAKFSNNTFKARPVEDVLEEIKKIKNNTFLFIDDNIIADLGYAKRLFKGLIHLKKKWYGQISVNATKDIGLLKLMEDSGCRGVFVGFESLSQDSLNIVNKEFNRADYYKEAVNKFHSHKMGVFAAFVLGFDNDKKDIFGKTIQFLKEADIDALQLTILTPFPGTSLFKKMDKEKRIFDKNWENYNLGHVVFYPKNMSPEELEKGHSKVLKDFYSWKSILGRFFRQLKYLTPKQMFISILISIGYRFKLKKTGYRI